MVAAPLVQPPNPAPSIRPRPADRTHPRLRPPSRWDAAGCTPRVGRHARHASRPSREVAPDRLPRPGSLAGPSSPTKRESSKSDDCCAPGTVPGIHRGSYGRVTRLRQPLSLGHAGQARRCEVRPSGAPTQLSAAPQSSPPATACGSGRALPAARSAGPTQPMDRRPNVGPSARASCRLPDRLEHAPLGVFDGLSVRGEGSV